MYRAEQKIETKRKDRIERIVSFVRTHGSEKPVSTIRDDMLNSSPTTLTQAERLLKRFKMAYPEFRGMTIGGGRLK